MKQENSITSGPYYSNGLNQIVYMRPNGDHAGSAPVTSAEGVAAYMNQAFEAGQKQKLVAGPDKAALFAVMPIPMELRPTNTKCSRRMFEFVQTIR